MIIYQLSTCQHSERNGVASKSAGSGSISGNKSTRRGLHKPACFVPGVNRDKIFISLHMGCLKEMNSFPRISWLSSEEHSALHASGSEHSERNGMASKNSALHVMDENWFRQQPACFVAEEKRDENIISLL